MSDKPSEQPTVDEAAIQALLKEGMKKKKKKKKDKEQAQAAEAADEKAKAASSTAADAPILPAEYDASLASEFGVMSYENLLGRVYSLLQANNPELSDRSLKKLKPPQVMRVGTTKSAWTNFAECCQSMKRSMDHVQAFFMAELGTTGSVDGSQRLTLRGKYLPKVFESLMRRYIAEYVTCRMCKSLDTTLERDHDTRLYFMSCTACNSQRSVTQIRTGFQAVGKGERRKARRKA